MVAGPVLPIRSPLAGGLHPVPWGPPAACKPDGPRTVLQGVSTRGCRGVDGQRSVRAQDWVGESKEPELGTAHGWEVEVLWGPRVTGTPSRPTAASPWGEARARSPGNAPSYVQSTRTSGGERVLSPRSPMSPEHRRSAMRYEWSKSHVSVPVRITTLSEVRENGAARHGSGHRHVGSRPYSPSTRRDAPGSG